MFYLNYNYSNAKLAKRAINCVKRYKIKSEKALRVKDIIEIIATQQIIAHNHTNETTLCSPLDELLKILLK